jgi:M6 family metalloprotease-like protein
LRVRAVFTSLILLSAVLGAGSARAGASLEVRRVIAPSDAAKLARRGPLNAALLNPAEQRHLADLEKRWRSFPDILTHGHVNWSQNASRRSGWRAQPRAAKSGSASAQNTTLSPPDTLHVAFLRIDFAHDRGGAASTGDGHFDLSGPDTTLPPIDRPPHNRTYFQSHAEALKRYHEAQSYGRHVIVVDVWPRTENGAYSMSDMADLGPWVFGQSIYPVAAAMLRGMVAAADTQSAQMGDRIPWDQYDRFVMIHAGSDLQSDVLQDSKEDIPSFTIGVADTDVAWVHDIPAPGDSFPIDRASIIPETNTQDGYYGAINGVLAHECGHLFYGFVDVYDVETGRPIVGYWSLMDSGNQVGSQIALADGTIIFATGLLPPSIDPYQRQLTSDLLRPVEVAYGDTMAILNGERNPDLRRVRLSSDEHLLIENRYLAPSMVVELDQDSLTHVVLGPKTPDKYEYDALLPGGGLLVWHVDESVIPLDSFFPIDTSLRVNPDFAINTNPFRLGLSVVEADGLGDLGDPSSPYILGAPFDPYFLSNNAVLSDSTHPNLLPHTGTHPHVTLNFLDDPGPTMHLSAVRNWQLPGWPIAASFPAGGPNLLSVDADGDRTPEVCWAGGVPSGPDSASLFAVRIDGTGLFGPDLPFAQLDRRPMPEMAAVPTGEFLGGGLPVQGPALFAVCTFAAGPDTSFAGGRVWLIDHFGQPVPGWPAPLPAIVTTPPLIVGIYPQSYVLVGCADHRVHMLRLDGTEIGATSALAAPISGHLAAYVSASDSCVTVAYADTSGVIAVQGIGACPPLPLDPQAVPAWSVALGAHGWQPDFVWVTLDGEGTPSDRVCAAAGPDLVVHDGDRLYAYCGAGQAIPGWGAPLGDTLVTGLAAGDIDGDGFPEVIAQTIHSHVMYVNRTGRPSPGWPKAGTDESFRTMSAPLALDVTASGHADLVALNASGLLVAFDAAGNAPAGWPLATGAGAAGSPLATDFNPNDGTFEIVAPDHLGRLYAYSLPNSPGGDTANPWKMMGGDAGRSYALPAGRTTTAAAASAGPLVGGSFKVYPNPARRRPVSFAYKLTEPAHVTFDMLDTSGHIVASFAHDGFQGDNVESWDPGRVPAGLYVARVKFHAGSREHTEVIPVGVLR